MTTKRREPTSPGEILEEEFLRPLGLTQKHLADHLGCDVKVINRIIKGRTSVTAEMALKLGAAFKTTAEFSAAGRSSTWSGNTTSLSVTGSESKPGSWMSGYRR